MAKRKKAAPVLNVSFDSLDETAYNLAVRVQCAIRDAIGTPVSLVEGLTIARELIMLAKDHVDLSAVKKGIEARAEQQEKERLERQAAIAATAGK